MDPITTPVVAAFNWTKFLMWAGIVVGTLVGVYGIYRLGKWMFGGEKKAAPAQQAVNAPITVAPKEEGSSKKL